MRISHNISRRSFAGIATAMPLVALNKLAAQTPESGTRTVTDVYGEIEVPANPQRVVVLDGPQLDACLAVGVKPVGGVTAFEGAPFPSYLGDAADGIENIGTISEPNLEAIIALEPDLILSSNLRHADIHDTLSEIAPTVFSEAASDDWRGNFLMWTNALNKEAEAAKIAAAFDTRLEEFRTATETERKDWVISVVRFLSDTVRLYNDTSFIGTILKAADLTRPESQIATEPDTVFTEISLEQVNLANGTHIFTCAYGEVKDSQAGDIVKTSAWESLDAVQNGQLYWVDDDFWMVAIGYLAADKVIDDLFAYLVDGDPGLDIPV